MKKLSLFEAIITILLVFLIVEVYILGRNNKTGRYKQFGESDMVLDTKTGKTHYFRNANWLDR